MDIHPPGSRRPAAGRRVKPTTNTAPASQGGGFLHGQPPEQKKKQARSSHPAAVPGGKTPRPPVRFPARVRPLRRAVCFLAPFPASQGRGACADNRPNRRKSRRIPQPPPAGKRPASGKCARPAALLFSRSIPASQMETSCADEPSGEKGCGAFFASRSRLGQGNAPLPANVPAPPPGPFSRLTPRFAQGVGFARTSPRTGKPRPGAHIPPLFARPAVGIWRISSFFHTFARRLCYNRGEREGRRRACGGRRNCRGRNCCNFPGGTRF